MLLSEVSQSHIAYWLLLTWNPSQIKKTFEERYRKQMKVGLNALMTVIISPMTSAYIPGLEAGFLHLFRRITAGGNGDRHVDG